MKKSSNNMGKNLIYVDEKGKEEIEQELEKQLKKLKENNRLKSETYKNEMGWCFSNELEIGFNELEKNEQIILKRIKELKDKLARVVVLKRGKNRTLVDLNDTVRIINSSSEGDEEMIVKLIGGETSFNDEIIMLNINSPLGQTIYQKEVGNTYTYQIENTTNKITILEKQSDISEEVEAPRKNKQASDKITLIRAKKWESIGYNVEDVLKMEKYRHLVHKYSVKVVEQKIEAIMTMGYTKEEVIKMTVAFPGLLNYKLEQLYKKLKDLIKLGYTKEEVIEMTKSFPQLYKYFSNNLKEKQEYYKEIGIVEILKTEPRKYRQKIALSYARYEFFKSIGINIVEVNYKTLFTKEDYYKTHYGITDKELVEKYDYEEYLKNKKKNQIKNNKESLTLEEVNSELGLARVRK